MSVIVSQIIAQQNNEIKKIKEKIQIPHDRISVAEVPRLREFDYFA